MHPSTRSSKSHAQKQDKDRGGRAPSLDLSDLTPEEIARQVLTTPPPSATLVGKADPDSSPEPERDD